MGFGVAWLGGKSLWCGAAGGRAAVNWTSVLKASVKQQNANEDPDVRTKAPKRQ